MTNATSMGSVLGPAAVYGSRDVSDLTGVSPRQLQWWDERGVVSPVQRSHRRLYSRFEVVQVSLVVALRQKGLSLKRSRAVLDAFKLYVGQTGPACLDPRPADAGLYLVTDGEKVYIAESLDETIEAILEAQKPVIGISLSSIISRVDGIDGPKPVQQETRSPSAWNGHLSHAS